MQAWTIVGYTADASVWCTLCGEAKYPGCDGDADVYDGEGNAVHVIFASDEGWEEDTCAWCGEKLKDCL